MPEKRIGDKKSSGMLGVPPRPILHKINDILAILLYLLWIVIGAFLILVIVGQIRQGALQSIFGGPNIQTQTEATPQVPAETDLPGIGRVNIQCVRDALSQEAIQKILTEGNISGLTAEEKKKFEPCVVADTSPTPNSPASSTKD